MPIYEVHHFSPLSMAQRDQIADGLTTLHSELFVTPRLFVNVHFNDVADKHTYVAGKRKQTNSIVATVRHGPSRTQDMYNNLCAEIIKVWNDAVGTEIPQHELRAIFILGSMVAGAEVGFPIPLAGEDKNWLEKNMDAFKEKADLGDEDFTDMLKELKVRDEFKGLVGDWKSEEDIKEEKKAEKKEKGEEVKGEE